MSERGKAGIIASYVILFLVLLFVLVPIWGMARLALDGALKSAPTSFRLLPEDFTLEVFQKVWLSPSQTLTLPGLLRNSMIVSLGAAVVSVVFGLSMAYAFARMRFPGRQAGLFGLFLGSLLPPVALMTPLYVLLSQVGLRTTLFGLMLVYASFSMPFCVWNMRGAFQAIPKELEEAAFLDGASRWTVFLRVSLSLALPPIAVAALLAFLMGYTEFAIGWLFVESSENVTLAMAISGMLSRSSTAWSEVSAMALLMTLPIVALFLLLNRYLVRGMMLSMGDRT